MTRSVTERERIVAVEMCCADGHNPYEGVAVDVQTDNPMHLVKRQVVRWELYVRDARLFIAGMAGIIKEAN